MISQCEDEVGVGNSLGETIENENKTEVLSSVHAKEVLVEVTELSDKDVHRENTDEVTIENIASPSSKIQT